LFSILLLKNLESGIPKLSMEENPIRVGNRPRPTLGVAVITMNEADRIPVLLESVRFADEVLVVDSGSTDGTQALCRKYGATVFEHPWMGYAAQKQITLEKAQSDWTLNLDADERVPEALAEEIRKAIEEAPPEVGGFSMPRLSFYLGRWIRHGGWYPDRKIRLVRKGSGEWVGGGLHERLNVKGQVRELSQPLFHYVYRNISDQLQTIDRFSGIAAKGKGPASGGYLLAGLGHALGKFAECYLWKLGFLDGWPGLIIASNSAWYVFLKHAKAWELGFDENHSPCP
jgi:glycosyltransferase involved in cell wall biosynthesis